MGCCASKKVANEILLDQRPKEKATNEGSVITTEYTDTESFELSADEYNLAGYTYQATIGRGSYAVVVQMSKDSISYAVKVCDICRARLNFMQLATHDPKEEAAILRKFDHPNVVKLFDFIEDTDNDKMFIVMELLSGGTIMSCSTLDQKRRAFAQTLSAVQYIHFQRIAHRDIKTDNVMRHEDGTIRLVDFGNSLFVPEDKHLVPVEFVGTPAYNSPEMFTRKEYDPFAADVWALGITLYCVVFGKLPLLANTRAEQQRIVVEEQPTFPDDADPDVVDLIQKMLEKDPSKRITIEEIWDHPFLNLLRSSMKMILQQNSQIFKSLSALDRVNSIMRVSRGSLRGLTHSSPKVSPELKKSH